MRFSAASLLLGLSLITPQSGTAARIYYTDQPTGAAGAVRAVNLDGSNPGVVVTYPSPANLRGIGFHRASGRIFVLDNGAKVIRSILPNGSGELTVIAVTATALGSDLEVDDIGNKIFWAESSTDALVNGLVRSCNPDGSEATTAVTTAGGTELSPYFLYVDRPGGYIYWGVQEAVANQNNSTTFRRATLAGAIDPNFGITSPTRSRDIAIDSITATAYFADRQQGTIYRRALSGGFNEIVFGGTSILNAPHGLALDTVARKVYWADTGQRGSGAQPSARKVSRCNFDGTDYENLTASNGTNEPWDMTLDLSSPTYADWQTRFFPAAAGMRLPLEDANGNGVVNLLEYAFDGNPRSGTPMTLPGPTAVGTGVQFPRRRVSPLSYRVEVSSDLLTWRYNGDGLGGNVTLETAVTAIDAEMDRVTVAATNPGSRTFFRVRVTTTEQ